MKTYARLNALHYVLPLIPGIAIFGAAAYIFFSRGANRPKPFEVLPTVKPADLLVSNDLCLGVPGAKSKLVVFVDYQCPFCIAEWKALKSLTNRNEQLAVYIRQLPLTTIHPNAMPAALTAKLAQSGGEYATMTDLLFTVKLSPKSIENAQRTLGITKDAATKLAPKARMAVDRDLKLAQRVGANSTPALFLIRDSGEVLRVQSPSALADLLE